MQFEEWASENLKQGYLSLIERIKEKELADDKVRDLVDLGGIDLVVAQDFDRFARDHDGILVALLKKEFSRKGVRLHALNQRSDGSAAGDLADKMMTALASYERSLIAQRTSVAEGERGKGSQHKELWV